MCFAVIADVIVSEMVVPALTAAGSGTKAQTDPPGAYIYPLTTEIGQGCRL